VNRTTVPALFIGASLLATSPAPLLASAEFSGRFALSTDSAGQSFLQVVVGPDARVQSLNRVQDSETSYNVLLDTEWEIGAGGPHRLLLENRFRCGSTLTRERFRLGYRYRTESGERLEIDSETEVENGKVFDRDETDARQSFYGRWVRPVADGGDRLEVYGKTEIRRVTADTLFFPRSHNLGRAKITWFHDIGILSSFDLGYAIQGVAVVDSAPGSYVEHEISGNLDLYAGDALFLNSETVAMRRVYVNSDTSSATGWELLSRWRVRWSVTPSVDLEAVPFLEATAYDRPDIIYFDYRKTGVDLGIKARPRVEIGLKLLPGMEILRAPGFGREDYDQFHVTLGGDVTASGLWLDVSWKVGRRDYPSPAPRDDLESVPRSDYFFSDLLLLAEKRIRGPVGFRVTASHDVEWHELREDDVSVFVVSTELSYRF